jgi:hypothetical protein
LKHEIRGETLDVSFNCFVESAYRDSIKLSDIRVQNHVFIAEPNNERDELLGD